MTSPIEAHAAPAASPNALVEPERFITLLREAGYDFFTGVPCSLVKGLIALLERDPEIQYYPETREDAAIGLACGAMLAGRQPVVVMQNTGFGLCINAFQSLTLMYRTPCLLLITWRGYRGEDAPETLLIGETLDRLLETIGIPFRIPDPESLQDDLRWATEVQRRDRLPAALLLRPGVTR